MPSTKRKIEIEITEAELSALRSVIYPTLPHQSADAFKIAKHFLHRINDSYYRDRIQKLELPKLEEIIDQSDDQDSIIDPSVIYNAIAVLRREYDFPAPIEMNLIDRQTNEIVPVPVNPLDVICIKTSSSKTGKGRRKGIFLAEWQFNPMTTSLKLVMKEYTVNNDELTFEGLIEKLDILNKALVQISKSAIVNLGYYHLYNKSAVRLVLGNAPQEINSFKVSEAMSGDFSFLDKYLIYRTEFLKRVLFQKLALGYVEAIQR